MVFDAHARGFAFFGGVPLRGIYDNMKTAVTTVCEIASKYDPSQRHPKQLFVMLFPCFSWGHSSRKT
jgi:transposase